MKLPLPVTKRVVTANRFLRCMDGISMTDTDGNRGEIGLVVSLMATNSGVRLVIERAKKEGRTWQTTVFVTSKEMARETLADMSMAEADINSLGLVVTAELSALLARMP
jgi:hypothetical protein